MLDSTLLKIVILGDPAVGKTALMKMYCKKKFDKNYQCTLGADFENKNVFLGDDVVTLQIWDTAGQERFQALVTQFYRGTDACILVYDITNLESFHKLGTWMDKFCEHANVEDRESFPFLIVANKSDLHDKREVTDEMADDWCARNGQLRHIITSAKVNDNVEEAFLEVIQLALDLQPEFEDLKNSHPEPLSNITQTTRKQAARKSKSSTSGARSSNYGSSSSSQNYKGYSTNISDHLDLSSDAVSVSSRAGSDGGTLTQLQSGFQQTSDSVQSTLERWECC